ARLYRGAAPAVRESRRLRRGLSRIPRAVPACRRGRLCARRSAARMGGEPGAPRAGRGPARHHVPCRACRDEQARVRLAPHPSAGPVGADHPADSIWRAVLAQDDAALAAIDPAAGPVWLLVNRAETGVEVRRLSEDAWSLTAALFAGRALHRAPCDAP